MTLPLIGIRFKKRDVAAAPVERTIDAAIISGGTVPIGRDQTRAEEGDVEFVRLYGGRPCWCCRLWRGRCRGRSSRARPRGGRRCDVASPCDDRAQRVPPPGRDH